jgi:NADH dehydrogenase
MLRGVEVGVGYIEDIDPAAHRVHIRRRQSGERFSVDYDALVVALGSITDFRAVPGMAEHALGVRTLGDAFYLRNRALSMLEEAASEPDPKRRKALLTFVVVGGGSTGVEVAAELEDLVRTAHRTFASLPQPEVILVHSRPYVVPEFGERLGRYATKKLRQAGVNVVLGRRLTRVEADHVELDDGSSIATATVVSTVGNAPHPVGTKLSGSTDPRGWIKPDATFAVPGLDAVAQRPDAVFDPRSENRSSDAGNRAACHSRRSSRRAEHPGRPRRGAARAV